MLSQAGFSAQCYRWPPWAASAWQMVMRVSLMAFLDSLSPIWHPYYDCGMIIIVNDCFLGSCDRYQLCTGTARPDRLPYIGTWSREKNKETDLLLLAEMTACWRRQRRCIFNFLIFFLLRGYHWDACGPWLKDKAIELSTRWILNEGSVSCSSSSTSS